jgi:hypothetical protein
MIEIQGFNKKQRLLADIIWALDTQDQVQAFIRSLPKKDREQAQVVCEMMILAFFDEVDTVSDTTLDIINKVKETK